jgi:signal transduction histidine kinase
MFTLARADAGNYLVRRDAMYLDEIVDEMVRASAVLASTKQVAVDLRNMESAALVGDEDLIRRLIGNLLDNAVRHAPPASTVRVELFREAGGYAVSVTDAGPGIPPEHQPHIFQRFYRADGSRARGPSDAGAGLGLALARWIAKVHGGDVMLAHSSPSGSTFTAFLLTNG